MTTASCIAVLCVLFTLSSAAPSATVQWHASAPNLGCVEVVYTRRGSRVPSRAQICDAPTGACVLSTQPNCGRAALGQPEQFRRVINVRGREHVFLYFESFGSVCWFSFLPACTCPSTFPMVQNMPLHNAIEKTEAEIQWHASAPQQGCVGISYRRPGTTVDSRAYFCDLPSGSCVYTFEQECPIQALFAPVVPFQRIINIRGREHAFRFYHDIGRVCYWSGLPRCFCRPQVMGQPPPPVEGLIQEDEDCRCETLPTGEKICDPWECDKEESLIGLQEKEDCHCETLPNGEKVCDPWECDKEGAVVNQHPGY